MKMKAGQNMTTDYTDQEKRASTLAPLGLGFPPAVPEAGAIAAFKHRFDTAPTWVYKLPSLHIYGPLPGADPRLPAGATWLTASPTTTSAVKDDQS